MIKRWFQNHPKYFIGSHANFTNVFRAISGKIRILPNFIIIGAGASGTHSLYNYLCKHQSILPSFSKEIYFFDLKFSNGINWYKGHFPTKITAHSKQCNKLLTGEASATYLQHPLTPKRIKDTIPNSKFIVLLRNPVDKSFAAYNSRIQHGDENLSFEEAIEMEQERLDGEFEKMKKNENYYSHSFYNQAYLTNSIYYDHLKKWFDIFPKKQFLILQSEHFFKNPSDVMKEVTDFLEISQLELPEYKQFNKHSYSVMSNKTRKKLIDYFKPHNQRLYKLIGTKFDW